MTTPDVSVIIAVYNTMPYLTTCLTSLVEQTIGRDRLEIIAVDDGSTDGSGAELDQFAQRYPGTFSVIHQANSGGPAAPSNRALERATGRYVFFVGSDDYLGSEALQRLVEAADRWDSDVVLGKMVGVNGRYVPQAIFASTEQQVDLFNSELPWALSNTKLFRRELIERYGLRFPEDLPMGSDQPFTIEACYRARRISVLADYEFYYAVRRENAQNITYSSRYEDRLLCAVSLIEFVAGLIGPGEGRDAILLRHFGSEVAKLLRKEFLDLDSEAQRQIHASVRKLTEQYLTDTIRDQLSQVDRLRLSMAQYGELDDLRELIRQLAGPRPYPVVAADGRWYRAQAGFRDPRFSFPDSWYDITERVVGWLTKLDATAMAWRTADDGTTVLSVTARSRRPELAYLSSESFRITAGEVVGTTTMIGDGEAGTVVTTDFAVDPLLVAVAPNGKHRMVQVQLSVRGKNRAVPLRNEQQLCAPRRIVRRGLRFYRVTPTTNKKGRLVITVRPVTLRRLSARLRRIWPSRGK